MKLYIGQQMVLPVLESVSLSKSRSEAAATLTATILLAAADTYIQKLSLALGDPVRLLDDEGAEAFLGSIHELNRTPETVTLTAYDRGVYLTRNELYGVYTGTPRDIVGQVAAELGIPVGTVEADGGWQTIVTGTGQSAFSILRQAVGEKREISIQKGVLCVTKSAYMVYELFASEVLEVNGVASIGGMVNRCVVAGRNGTVYATAQNSADRTTYGQFQTVLAKSGSDPSGQARSALAGREMTGEVTVLGKLAYRCGAAVELHRPEWGLDGVYAVTASEHRWEAGSYTTGLRLEFVR